MPPTRRTDPDTDEPRDDPTEPPAGGARWRRLFGLLLIFAVTTGLAFGIPYLLVLNHQVTQRFGQLRWQIPTRVYARPLQLRPGLAMDAATLKLELDAAAYQAQAGAAQRGSYESSDAGRWLINNRGFDDVDGRVAPRKIEVRLGSGRVQGLRDVATGKPIKAARLDPARIATLYGQQQEDRELVRLNDVPELLVTGLQAVEDRDFASHHGVDFGGILRAIWINLKSGSTRQGASTLTQQLARSGLLGIGREQTLSRKANEALYALLIEAHYDKRTILETYLNQVYLGQRGASAVRGVAAGAEFWFGKPLQDLSPEQIALLIGMVRGPSYYDPRRAPERALSRRNFVLTRMHTDHLIDDATFARAMAAPLGVTARPSSLGNRFPTFTDLARRQLLRDYPPESLQGAGLAVMTTMAPSAQAYAEAAAARTLAELQQGKRPPLQVGMVVTDVHDGDVLAVVGARDPRDAGFNRALDAARPIGSIVKPFVYLLALAQPARWSMASWLDDSPQTIALGRGRSWTPGNADGRSHGPVRLIDALAQSYNQATVWMGMQIGPERVAELLKALGGMTVQANPSLLLGATDQSPYAMAQLYQFLASGGEIQPLHAVRGVLDAEGRALTRYDREPAAAQPGDALAARLVTLAAQQVVAGGTARALLADGLGRLSPAGKTGTSNDSRDSWFAGWTGDALAVVWVGNDQNQPTGLYGATGGMRVWSKFFQRWPSAPLRVSGQGMEWQWVLGDNSTDEGCPDARRFAFVAGFAPAYQPCTALAPQAPADGSGEDDGGHWWDRFFGRAPAPPPPPATPPPAPSAQPASPP
jgi:penicillin-binding protein 1B